MLVLKLLHEELDSRNFTEGLNEITLDSIRIFLLNLFELFHLSTEFYSPVPSKQFQWRTTMATCGCYSTKLQAKF